MSRLRIICKEIDCVHAACAGGSVLQRYKTFDVEISAEMATWLTEKAGEYIDRTISGAELLASAPELEASRGELERARREGEALADLRGFVRELDIVQRRAAEFPGEFEAGMAAERAIPAARQRVLDAAIRLVAQPREAPHAGPPAGEEGDAPFRCLICGGLVHYDGTPPDPQTHPGPGRKPK